MKEAVFDIGNSEVTVTVFTDGRRDGGARLSSRADKTPDEAAAVLAGVLGRPGEPAVDAAYLGGVVPRLVPVYHSYCRDLLGVPSFVVTAASAHGLRLDVPDPASVGVDRIAGVLALRDRFGGPAVLVDAGTAVNIEFLDGSGAFAGGAIAPGPGLMSDALTEKGARLGAVDLTGDVSPVGRTTGEALRAGIVLGCAGLVDGLVSRMTRARGVTRVVATGGHAALLARYCETVTDVIPGLVSEGLLTAGRRVAAAPGGRNHGS